MYKSGFKINYEELLHAAVHNSSLVSVWQDEKVVEKGGLVQSFTDDYVTINGIKFYKSISEFRCLFH